MRLTQVCLGHALVLSSGTTFPLPMPWSGTTSLPLAAPSIFLPGSHDGPIRIGSGMSMNPPGDSKGTYIEDPSEGLASMHRFAQRCDQIRPDLIVSLYGERSFVAGHLVLKGMGIATAFVVERTFDAWVRRRWWKETAKAFLFRSADVALVHTAPPPAGGQHNEPSDAFLYAVRYGFPPDRAYTGRTVSRRGSVRQRRNRWRAVPTEGTHRSGRMPLPVRRTVLERQGPAGAARGVQGGAASRSDRSRC